MKQHLEPPSSAYVLIADQYHMLVYHRGMNHRRIFPHPVLEYYLGGRLREGLPPPVASFATRQEAEVWLQNEAAPPKQAVISIAGELYLAVHHPNIHHRSLYPFSMARSVMESEVGLATPANAEYEAFGPSPAVGALSNNLKLAQHGDSAPGRARE